MNVWSSLKLFFLRLMQSESICSYVTYKTQCMLSSQLQNSLLLGSPDMFAVLKLINKHPVFVKQAGHKVEILDDF
jgi:hypothetical protein